MKYAVCDCCNKGSEPYMFKDSTWKKCSQGKYDILCLTCAASILGRKFRKSDFSDFPINKGVFGFDVGLYFKYGITDFYPIVKDISEIIERNGGPGKYQPQNND
jgi:hypothetical protein